MRTHNSQTFLVEAIESVLRQLTPEWELVISDDGSTDRTLDIARHYQSLDNRVRVLEGNHLGPAENGNRALRDARFPWICVLDSDDVAFPERTSLCLTAAAKNPDVVLWGGRAVLIDRFSRPLRTAHLGPSSLDEYHAYRRQGRIIFVMSPTAMFRRDLALRLGGYNPEMEGAEDVDLMTRMAEHGPVISLNFDLAYYRIHGASISSTRFDDQQRVFDFLDQRTKLRLSGEDTTMARYLNWLEEQPTGFRLRHQIRARGRRYYRAAVVNAAERRRLMAGIYAAGAVILDPQHALTRISRRIGWR